MNDKNDKDDDDGDSDNENFENDESDTNLPTHFCCFGYSLFHHLLHKYCLFSSGIYIGGIRALATQQRRCQLVVRAIIR